MNNFSQHRWWSLSSLKQCQCELAVTAVEGESEGVEPGNQINDRLRSVGAQQMCFSVPVALYYKRDTVVQQTWWMAKRKAWLPDRQAALLGICNLLLGLYRCRRPLFFPIQKKIILFKNCLLLFSAIKKSHWLLSSLSYVLDGQSEIYVLKWVSVLILVRWPYISLIAIKDNLDWLCGRGVFSAVYRWTWEGGGLSHYGNAVKWHASTDVGWVHPYRVWCDCYTLDLDHCSAKCITQPPKLLLSGTKEMCSIQGSWRGFSLYTHIICVIILQHPRILSRMLRLKLILWINHILAIYELLAVTFGIFLYCKQMWWNWLI